MTEQQSFRGWYSGQHYPNPQAFGFSWKAMQKLTAEQQRLFHEQRESGRREQQIKADIERLRREKISNLAASIRAERRSRTAWQ